jgi:hypothetical protein
MAKLSNIITTRCRFWLSRGFHELPRPRAPAGRACGHHRPSDRAGRKLARRTIGQIVQGDSFLPIGCYDSLRGLSCAADLHNDKSTRLPGAVRAVCRHARVLAVVRSHRDEQQVVSPWGKTSSGGKISKTSDAGLRNLAKRHLPGGTSPTSVEVAEFKTLQQDIDALTHADAATKKTAFTPTRTLLQQLSTSHSTLSEGDLVGVSGFLHRAENGSAAETVNGGGADGRDIHLNINATQYGTTFDE